MKRWALVVVVLYGLLFVALTLPAIGLASGEPVEVLESVKTDSPEILRKLFLNRWYLIVLSVFLLCQAALLVVPVRAAGGKPVGKRSILLLVTVTGFLTGCLVLGAWCAVSEFILKKPEKVIGGWWALAPPAVMWLLWALVFSRMSRGKEALDVVARQCRHLFKGSILELLVVVPTHVVARMRNDCCGGFLTFTGIAFGLAVMLLSYGPGVLFLFTGKWRELRKGKAPLVPSYSLRTVVFFHMLLVSVIGLALGFRTLEGGRGGLDWKAFLMLPALWLSVGFFAGLLWSSLADRRMLNAMPGPKGPGSPPPTSRPEE